MLDIIALCEIKMHVMKNAFKIISKCEIFNGDCNGKMLILLVVTIVKI